MTDNRPSSIWLFLEVLARRRGLIVGLILLAIVSSVAVALVLPEWYTSTGLILPAPDQAHSGLTQLGRVSSVTGTSRAPGMITPQDVYARILRSRRVADRVIADLNLTDHFSLPVGTALYQLLAFQTDFSVTEEGLLQISAEDRDAEFAAILARGYVEALLALNKELLASSARQKRELIEERLNQVKLQLDSARAEMEDFQVTHRAIDFGAQTRLAIDQATDLKIRLATLDLDIQMLGRVLGAANPELTEKKQRRVVIQGQLDALEWGGGDSSFFSLPLASVPGLKGQYESLYARVRVNESLYETLLGYVEQARIQEEDEIQSLTVLDWPTTPELRSRPQRSLIVLGATALSTVLAILLALWLELVRRLREEQPDDHRRLMSFAAAFFGWLPGVRRPVKK